MGTGANRGGVVLAVINTPTYAPIWDALNRTSITITSMELEISPTRWRTWHVKNNKDKENRLLASGNVLLTLLPELSLNQL